GGQRAARSHDQTRTPPPAVSPSAAPVSGHRPAVHHRLSSRLASMTGLAGSGHGSAVARSSQATSHDFAASDALARKPRGFGWQRVFYGSAEDAPLAGSTASPTLAPEGVRDECQRTHPRTAVEDVRSGWLAKARRRSLAVITYVIIAGWPVVFL